MAKHGIKGVIGGGVAEGGAMHNVVEGYRDALGRVGRDAELGEDLSIGFHFRLAKTQEEGIKAAAKHYEENLKMFGPLRLVRALSDAQIEAMSDPRRAPFAGLPTLDEAVKKGAFLCGPPELIIEQLMRLEERYPGLERIGVSHPVSTPHTVMLEQWEWFAAEVMPAFTKRVQEPVPAN
jgi:alkanesulfonate monooxygenase SsuD/methylene tetrahydromethanopterin reductase-like flavin-dependent oxidoreductase (luciferase family)